MNTIQEAVYSVVSENASVYDKGCLTKSGVKVILREEPEFGKIESVYIVDGLTFFKKDMTRGRDTISCRSMDYVVKL